MRMGGSSLFHGYGLLGNDVPDMDDPEKFSCIWKCLQDCINQNLLLAYHDRSDGGVITTLLEMAICTQCGLDIRLPLTYRAGHMDELNESQFEDSMQYMRMQSEILGKKNDFELSSEFEVVKFWQDSVVAPLFNEELGVVVQVERNKFEFVKKMFLEAGLEECSFVVLGNPIEDRRVRIAVELDSERRKMLEKNGIIKYDCDRENNSSKKNNSFEYNDCLGVFEELDRNFIGILDSPLVRLWHFWEHTSFQLEYLQTNPDCVEMEKRGLQRRSEPNWRLTFDPDECISIESSKFKQHRVAIIREEGSNGDREMAAAFFRVGFEVWDVTMNDIFDFRVNLDNFKGIAFVGGFSYADVFDSAKGWAAKIKFSAHKIKSQFDSFFKIRNDTFSIGVCNGCQLMTLLGYVPFPLRPDLGEQQPRFVHNISSRFESRFVSVRVLESPSIFLRGMHGSSMGIWIAHGEGRAFFPTQQVLKEVLKDNLAPLRYVDDKNHITDEYPHNPNGSVEGIAALTSPDGRHLAIMPHCERTFLIQQFPWIPQDWAHIKRSPWLKIFQNAYEWATRD